MADIRVAGERLVFDAGVWDEEVERFDRDGLTHRCAIQARRFVERPGARVALRACDSHGADGTRLAGHAKAYVPLDVEPSRARFGFVFLLASGGDGRVMAWLAAYGERHPPPGVRSVYERAHKRLHGRYPDQ